MRICCAIFLVENLCLCYISRFFHLCVFLLLCKVYFLITAALTLTHLLILHSCDIVPHCQLSQISRKQWTPRNYQLPSTCCSREICTHFCTKLCAHFCTKLCAHFCVWFSVSTAVLAMLKQWQLSPPHLRRGHRGPDIGDLLIRGLITSDPKIAHGYPP